MVQRERGDSTPELDCFADVVHNYKYECEQQHAILTLAQVDRLRNKITDTEYCRREAEITLCLARSGLIRHGQGICPRYRHPPGLERPNPCIRE